MCRPISRRDMMRLSVAAAAAALTTGSLPAFGFADGPADEELLPFLNPQPATRGGQVQWSELREWVTPSPNLFGVQHYGIPKVDPAAWKLHVAGRVEKPISLTLDQIKARPKKEITATLECSGNGSNPGFMGAIGNVKWGGTPLKALLEECGVKNDAVEIAFWGADRKTEKIRNMDFEQNFARTLSLDDSNRDDVLLCYEMNGKPLETKHGAPLRLVVPGWYGIAWVKWLETIEARDRRLMAKYIAREYVTIRGEQQGDQIVWKESSVGPMNVKSIVAKVARRKDGALLVSGAAWTQGRIKGVELKIDDGPWRPVKMEERDQPDHTWSFWTYEWKDAPEGEHTLVSRATDERGRVQPSAEDPEIKLKKTYWEANQQYPRRIVV